MKADKNLLSGSTTLLVLSLLAAGDKYGYEMIAELEAKSDDTFTLKEGTLYPILHGLENDGAVNSYEKEAPAAARGSTTTLPKRAFVSWTIRRPSGRYSPRR